MKKLPHFLIAMAQLCNTSSLPHFVIKPNIKLFYSLFETFFSINMNYTLNRKNNKYSSLFDISDQIGENKKYNFYLY